MSNFDTSLRDNLLKEYEAKFGKDKILLIRRSYIFFFLVVLSPLGGMLLLLLLLLASYLFIANTGSQVIDNIVGIVILIACTMILLTTFTRVIKRFWDYTMDFAIITPHEIVHYNQQGMINRQIKTMDMEKVKTINLKGGGLVESFFNFGSLIFLSEGDSEYGDLTLSYVYNAMNIKKKIIEIKNHGEELDKE